jgi:hypothetical protein
MLALTCLAAFPPLHTPYDTLRLPACPPARLQSFSSVGALEAAWYRATGKQLLFSEQHMIDCAWEAGNSGCYGAYCPALLF